MVFVKKAVVSEAETIYCGERCCDVNESSFSIKN